MSQKENLDFDICGIIKRAASIESSNQQDRTIEVSFASEAMIDKGAYYEVLSHSSGDYDFTWFNSGNAPVLVEHDNDDHVGVVQSAWVDESTRKSRAVIKIATDTESTEIWTKITDGVLRNVSVGAKANGYRIDRTGNPDKPIVYVSWEPQELSLCAVPVDKQVGIARSENSVSSETKAESNVIDSVVSPNASQEKTEIERSVSVVVSEVNPQKQNQLQNNNKGLKMTTENLSADDIVRAERARVDEIASLGDQFKQVDIARAAIQSGKSVNDFKNELLGALKTNHRVDSSIGLSNQEVKEYSIARAVQAIVTGDMSQAGYELEVSRAQGSVSGNFVIPDEVIARAAGVAATTFAANAATGLKTRGPWIESLKAKTIAGRLGVTTLGGLQGAFELPRFTAFPTAREVAEGQDGTIDQMATELRTLSPKSMFAFVKLTRQHLRNLPALETYIQYELIRSITEQIDRKVFAAVVANTDIDWKVTPTSGVTYNEIRALITKLTNANVNVDYAKFAMDGNVDGYLSSTLKSDNTAAIYLKGDDGRVAGLPSEFSSTVGNKHLILGDWSKVFVGSWSPIELERDISQGFTSGEILIRAATDFDVGVAVPEAFTGYLDLVV